MPTNYLAVAGVSVVLLGISVYKVREALQQLILRRHGVTTIAVVLTVQRVEQKNSPMFHLTVTYLDAEKNRHQIRLTAPNSEDRFYDYKTGDEVLVCYHPQHPDQCELAEVLDIPWWSGPLVPAIFLGATGSYFLLKALPCI
ncbi:DUF3592 domain-containing protein [Hymenobacter metallilatus]|uniref:DUF3592 domain-containing protein n=1 Tax=Hymenobacter metallilatus TaxID=2493666 RepID=A0A3R9NDW7_9BACT|nr:DUF3592 domain-containing protein [Hymenobacter metallilatus]RSK29784.1 DUF3592 domain-containing protein [Hymenobacter metallilatus]